MSPRAPRILLNTTPLAGTIGYPKSAHKPTDGDQSTSTNYTNNSVEAERALDPRKSEADIVML